MSAGDVFSLAFGGVVVALGLGFLLVAWAASVAEGTTTSTRIETGDPRA